MGARGFQDPSPALPGSDFEAWRVWPSFGWTDSAGRGFCPPGSLPPPSVLVSLCCVLSCPSLCCPPLLVPAAPGFGAFSFFGSSLSLCRLSPVSSVPWCFGLMPWAEFVCACGHYSITVVCGGLPSSPLFLVPFPVLRFRLSGFVSWSGVFGPPSWVLWGCLFGEVGPARSHGLDCTAASFTGADQWSSLPCYPERPRAAKPANMVLSVRIQRHCGYGTL